MGVIIAELDIREFARGLSPELKARAAKCQSAEELIALAEEYGIELPESALEAINGGVLPCRDMCQERSCSSHGSFC